MPIWQEESQRKRAGVGPALVAQPPTPRRSIQAGAGRPRSATEHGPDPLGVGDQQGCVGCRYLLPCLRLRLIDEVLQLRARSDYVRGIRRSECRVELRREARGDSLGQAEGGHSALKVDDLSRRTEHRDVEPCARLIAARVGRQDRKSTRLNSSHLVISYAVFCLKKKKTTIRH